MSCTIKRKMAKEAMIMIPPLTMNVSGSSIGKNQPCGPITGPSSLSA
jgi:hypothetical protein